MLTETYARFELNLSRVDSLLSLYQQTKKTEQGRKDIRSLDILRAATVFLHATLEDFVRGIIVWRYPSLGSDVLDRVPLKGLSASGRPERFLLGRLVAFNGLLVEDVLEQSVEEYANGLSLNNTTDLVSHLSCIGISEASLKPYLPELGALMKRRHHIVHQADKNEKSGPGQQLAKSIGLHTVKAWAEAVQGFVSEICQQLPPE